MIQKLILLFTLFFLHIQVLKSQNVEKVLERAGCHVEASLNHYDYVRFNRSLSEKSILLDFEKQTQKILFDQSTWVLTTEVQDNNAYNNITHTFTLSASEAEQTVPSIDLVFDNWSTKILYF